MEREILAFDPRGRDLRQGDKVRMEDGTTGMLAAVDRVGKTGRLWVIPDSSGSGLTTGNGLWAEAHELEFVSRRSP